MNTTDTDEKRLSTREGATRVHSRNEDESSGMSAAKNSTKSRSKSPSIESVGQLLRLVYGGKFKRSTFKNKELAAMHLNPLPTVAERKELLGLAQSDLVLDKTRQLMLLDLRVDDAITSTFRDFAQEVLQEHPLFDAKPLAETLRNLPESVTEERATSVLLAQELDSVSWPEQPTPLTKQQFSQCKSNAVHCLLMIFRATRDTSLNRILSHLNSGLWEPTTRRHSRKADKLAALISTRDPAAASVTFGLLESDAIEQRRLAETARRSEQRAIAYVESLKHQVAEVERRLEEAEAAMKRVSEELVSATELQVTEKAHWNDRHEQLRGQMRRWMKEELKLLDEGLHALHRDPPKVHVMIDHAERAIDGLKREMNRLQGSE